MDLLVAELANVAERRIDELDVLGRLPADLATEVVAAGLFRQLVPTDLGGWNSTPLDWFRRGVRIAAVEAALGWVVTQGAVELGWIAAGGDPDWAAHVLADPLASSASTVAGLGTLRVEGGVARLNGRWPFNTGCHDATWIGGLALVNWPMADSGSPLRMCWVPADRAVIHDDWDANGLRGSGSASVEIPDQDVPLAWTISLFEPTANDRGPHRVLVGNGNWPIGGSVAATLLGIARRALDETTAVVASKAPAPAFTPMSTDPGVLRRLTDLEGQWAAAVALIETELDAMWSEAAVAGSLTADRRVRLATACTHARLSALAIVDGAAELAGTAVVYRRAPLARCLRDAHTLRGHIATGPAVLEHASRVRLGLAEPNFLV